MGTAKRFGSFVQENNSEREKAMEKKFEVEAQEVENCCEEPKILEEIQVEELAIDGICGVY